MQHDFTKPSHVTSAKDIRKKTRLPVYILFFIGLFLFAMLSYMVSQST